jgi:hypothetical protein
MRAVLSVVVALTLAITVDRLYLDGRYAQAAAGMAFHIKGQFFR